MNDISVTRPYRKRRQYTPEFKAQLVAECQSPGTSVSRIALDNDLNANLLRRWIGESKQRDQGQLPAFVPLRLPATDDSTAKPADKERTIRIEIPRAGGPVVVEWPAEESDQCVVFLRELL